MSSGGTELILQGQDNGPRPETCDWIAEFETNIIFGKPSGFTEKPPGYCPTGASSRVFAAVLLQYGAGNLYIIGPVKTVSDTK